MCSAMLLVGLPYAVLGVFSSRISMIRISETGKLIVQHVASTSVSSRGIEVGGECVVLKRRKVSKLIPVNMAPVTNARYLFNEYLPAGMSVS